MGIVFVLIVWLLFWLFIASFIGIVLGIRSYRKKRGASKVVRIWGFVKSFSIPILLVFYFLIAFIVYGTWCELSRGVDPGIGDLWQIPLGNHYSLIAIDLPSQAHIETSSGNQIYHDLTAIGREGNIVYGKDNNNHQYFIINTSDNTIETLVSEKIFLEKMKIIGINTLKMEPPETFYTRCRWNMADLMAAILIVFIPISAFIGVRRLKKTFRREEVRGRP